MDESRHEPAESSAEQTATAPNPKPDRDRCAAFLEATGWTRAVAGDHDFENACTAFASLAEDPRRGILLMGKAGVGKTALGNAVFRAIKGDRRRIDCSDSDQVDALVPQSLADMNGGSYCSGADDLLGMSVMLDDLGAENLVQSYGNVLNRVGEFLIKYHTRGTGHLVITTNLSSAELNAKYGSRVVDRLADLCVVMHFSGSSKRNRMVLK